jgi:hypothetical protein
VFGFVTGMAFTFASESRSPSDRNAVRLPTGIAFGIDRIHHRCSNVREKRHFDRQKKAIRKAAARSQPRFSGRNPKLLYRCRRVIIGIVTVIQAFAKFT